MTDFLPHRGAPRRNRVRDLAALLALTLLALPAAWAQDRPERIEIVVREGQSLRELAGDYLGDPDLWRELLRANGLSLPTEVRPGVRLRVPRNEVTLALRALDDALAAIREATEIGAQVLAGTELREAVALRDRALGQRTARDWGECRELAQRAEAAAKKALDKARSQRSAPATASLTTFTGRAETWPPGRLGWQRAAAGEQLVEREKVRTLARSSALVTFLDQSRLELGAESQAIIEKVRVDKLRGRPSAGVSLVQGDLMALLRGSKASENVKLDVPGLEKGSTSRDFWVGRDGQTTRLANYDDEEMLVESAGSTVTLGKNQGTLLVGNAAPAAPRDLLPAPQLRAPEDGAVSYDDDLGLRWQPVDAAVAYRVEIGRDAELRDLVTSPQRAERTEHRLTGLDNGHYYWRVASIDELGFPGPRGRARRLRILRDTTPPFLRIESPRPGTNGTVASAGAPITVVGKTEPSARVDCGGESVVVEPSGRFAHSLRLGPGEQTLVVEATDPAGNRTRREVRVARDAPSGPLAFASDLPRLSPGVFVARGPEFVLSGTGRPHADLRVVAEAWTGRTRTDAQGSFRLLVPLRSERQDFEVTVGDGEPRKRFAVVVDREPPVLEVAAPPGRTRADRVRIAGRATGASLLRVQGTAVDVSSGRFDVEVALAPGANTLRVVALDQVGNQAFWQTSVVSDNAAPELLGHRARRFEAPDDDFVELVIEAADPSGLRRTARVGLRAGDARLEALLVLDSGGRTYRGEIRLPQGTGTIAIRHVDLGDSLGNRQTYPLAGSFRWSRKDDRP